MIKIILMVLVLFSLVSCEMDESCKKDKVKKKKTDIEYNSEYCVNTCISSMISEMDDSSFSQSQHNQFYNVVKYCNSLRKYKCKQKNGKYYYNYGFDFDYLSKWRLKKK